MSLNIGLKLGLTAVLSVILAGVSAVFINLPPLISVYSDSQK